MIYICGDSFGVPDSEHGTMWADHLSALYPVCNLSQVCASNLMISQQVDHAIQQRAQFIILLCTASTRGQTRLNKQVVPYSIHSLDHTTPFSKDQLAILKSHVTEFFDLNLAIYENKCIIESMLSRLVASKIPFSWDQGGFEHPSYSGTKTYFNEYNKQKSKINLWDYASKRTYRPYYHITNEQLHRNVAQYYSGLINEQT